MPVTSATNSTTSNINNGPNKKGILSNLGIGKTMLTQDTIDKLKEADERFQISPYDRKLEDNKAKREDLKALKTIAKNFKDSFRPLAKESSYLQRKVVDSGSNSVSASVDPGVKLQDINIHVKSLAKQDVFQSKSINSRDDKIAEGLTSKAEFYLKVGDKEHKLSIDSNTTYSDLVQQINDSGANVTARILNVGGENPNRMIIQSTEAGLDNSVKFAYRSSELDSDGNKAQVSDDMKNNVKLALAGFGLSVDESASNDDAIKFDESKFTSDGSTATQIQKASDAEFTYNGIEIKRSTNRIDDLINGVTFTLNKADKGDDSTNISIVNDPSRIEKSADLFVSAYNQFLDALQLTTKYDPDTGDAGTLQGVNEINQMKSGLRRMITGINSQNQSLQDFGFSFDPDGKLKLDKDEFITNLNSDFDKFKDFFSSTTKYSNVSMEANSAIKSGNMEGKFKINGIEISIKLDKNKSAEENAKQIAETINDAGILGVKASIKDGNKLFLQGNYGVDVGISASKNDENSSDFIKSLGLSEYSLHGGSEKIDGFFDKLDKLMEGYVGNNSVLTNFSDSLDNEEKNLDTNKERIQKTLDKKYELMAAQFTAYERAMASLTKQFESMKSTFDALLKSGE